MLLLLSPDRIGSNFRFFTNTPILFLSHVKIPKKREKKSGDLYKQNRARRAVLTPCQSGRGAKAFSHHPSSRPLAGVNAHGVQAAAKFIRVSGTGEVAGGGSVDIDIGVLVSTPALIPYKVPGIIHQGSKIHARSYNKTKPKQKMRGVGRGG